MGDKTKQDTSQLNSFTNFEDAELQSTMEDFLREEERASKNIWNFATIVGIAMFFVGMLYLIQTVGLGIGPDLSGIIEFMPLVGGILVTLVGFGFIVGERKKKSKSKWKRKLSKDRKQFDFEDEDLSGDESFNLKNDLDSEFFDRKSRSKTRSKKLNFDRYAFRKTKKLYKSRTDRKWSGVCGGLAKYFGISSTVIRLLFIITFFAGSGTSLLVYIALAIALDKEPPELMDDFDY